MKKIAILLLLASNSFLVIANAEINACIAGVNARGGSPGVSLLVTGNEQTIDGGTACSAYKDLRTQAACIFGYNTIIPMMFQSNVIPGNHCTGVEMAPKDNGTCTWWWPYNYEGCRTDPSNSCCVCDYPGTIVTDTTSSLYNKPDGYGVCQYGKAISWNLNPSTDHKSTLGNYYYNQLAGDTNIIKLLWGVGKNKNSKDGYASWLNYIKNYIVSINSSGQNNLFLDSRFVTNKVISGSQAITQAS